MTVELMGVRTAKASGLVLSCPLGTTALVEDEPSSCDELVEIIAGILRPRRGKVRVFGRDPYGAPDVRRRLASLLAVEELLDEPTLEASVGKTLALRESNLRARDVLDAFDLGGLVESRPNALGGSERRAVALALALSVDAPSVVVLHEPLSAGAPRARVLSGLATLGANAVVIAITASLRDAQALGGRIVRVGRRGVVPDGDAAVPPRAVELVAKLLEGGAVAERLTGEAAVRRVTWDSGGGELVVEATDLDAATLALFSATRAAGAVIVSLSHRPTPRLVAPEAARGSS
jgi:ABC-type thiamine transport system ATPase subunit